MLRAIRQGRIRIAVSVALILEYESVLTRQGLIPHFTRSQISNLIDGFCHLAHLQEIFFAWRPFLSAPNDDLVLEVAFAASSPFIITHNLADFRGTDSLGVCAITPAQALKLINQ